DRGLRTRVEHADAWRLRGLLRARRERPRRRAADERDEFAAFHSITSSARANSESGTVRPSDLAVFRLTTSSYLVCACTATSDGFSPLRMRSTEPAARRNGSSESVQDEDTPA